MPEKTFYVNQCSMDNLGEELAGYIANKYGVSREAGSQIIALLWVDKLRGDRYTLIQVPWLEEVERAGLGWFKE